MFDLTEMFHNSYRTQEEAIKYRALVSVRVLACVRACVCVQDRGRHHDWMRNPAERSTILLMPDLNPILTSTLKLGLNPQTVL